MVAAGLLAKKAVARGLRTKPWVKTSLAPGSRVVTDYLAEAGLVEPLEAFGYHLVGYGCTTCIGNSGPLLDGVSDAVARSDLAVCAVLSGNRNFEGRIHPDVRMNYLASPPLVVAYALAGTLDTDLVSEPLGTGTDGAARVPARHLADSAEVAETVRGAIHSDMFRQSYERRVHRRRELAQPRRRDRYVVPLGALVELHTPTSVLRGHGPRPRARTRHRGGQGPRRARRQHHHRPHLACGLHQARQPGRPLPGRARPGAVRLQLLRRPARQPRSDGAGHVRQRPAAQPSRARHRGRPHRAPARRRADRRSTRRRSATATRGSRSWCWPAPTTAPARRGIGRPRARCCSASRPCWPESFERIHRSNLVDMGVLPLEFVDGDSVETARPHRPRGLRDPRARCAELRRGPRAADRPGGRHRVLRPPPHRHHPRSRLLPPRRDPHLRASPARGRLT